MGIDPSSIPGLDPDKPSVARIYDSLLGGSNNLPIDRHYAERSARVVPEVRAVVRANREFLAQAVRYMCQAGVQQFLDLGSGLPSQGNVHEVAEAATGGAARTVYVDYDPVAVLHGQAMLGESTTALYLLGDLRDSGSFLDEAGRWLDFTRPVGILMMAVLHNLDADDATTYAIVDRLKGTLSPGSHLVLSHVVTGEGADQDAADRVGTGMPWNPRPLEDVRALFAGMDLVPPGLVPVADWRPSPSVAPSARQSWLVGGVGVVVGAPRGSSH